MEKQSMELWDKVKSVPQSALKEISAGRLKGKSDINPQWRYQVITETFGVCGFGWKYTIDKKWMENSPTGEIAAFVDISFYFKKDGEWSEAIPANGGSMFVANERQGLYTSDECYKMAITDALGTAMKMIGVAADVYLGKKIDFGTKYDENPQYPAQKEEAKPWLNLVNKDGSYNDQYAKLKASIDGGQTYTLDAIRAKYSVSKQSKEVLATLGIV
jgi:DNA modification methylase